ARPGPTADRVVGDNRDDRADHGHNDRGDVDPRDVVLATGQEARNEPADQRADDPQHDVADDAEALIALDEETGDVACDRPDYQPRNDAHSNDAPSSTMTPRRIVNPRITIDPAIGHRNASTASHVGGS